MNTALRQATKKDISKLITLNHIWYRPNLTGDENGFLSVIYDNDFFDKIVDNNDIIVFEQGENLVGYVLVNDVLENEHIVRVKKLYYDIKPILKSRKIAFSYQILVDRILQGTGFFYEAQEKYFSYFRTKYEYLVSTVNKENIRSILGHKKAGWSFFDTDHHFYIIDKEL